MSAHVCVQHQVLLLVWDDTTNNMPGLGPGVMGTSDEKTNTYFKDTEVTCILCPRQGGVEDSYLQVTQPGSSSMYVSLLIQILCARVGRCFLLSQGVSTSWQMKVYQQLMQAYSCMCASWMACHQKSNTNTAHAASVYTRSPIDYMYSNTATFLYFAESAARQHVHSPPEDRDRGHSPHPRPRTTPNGQ
jgi:hypothetical protein